MGLQFSDEDVEAAVGAGVLTDEAAAGLRLFVERRHATPAADEESFRQLTGFNDSFVALAGAGVLTVATLVNGGDAYLYAVLCAGLITFALALAWDMSDPMRRTRRSDVAFWLHLLAAPAIVHPAFGLLGLARLSLFGAVTGIAPQAGPGGAILAFAIYAALGGVALIV